MRDNAQVNVSRKKETKREEMERERERVREISMNVCTSSPGEHDFRNYAQVTRKQNNLLAINNLEKQIGIIILDGIMPEDREISANCVLCDQLEQNNISPSLIVAVAVYYSLNDMIKLSSHLYFRRPRYNHAIILYNRAYDAIIPIQLCQIM